MLKPGLFILCLFLLAGPVTTLAAESQASPPASITAYPKAHGVHSRFAYETWDFSGQAFDEAGNHYGYFFKVFKRKHILGIVSRIVDFTTSKKIFFYEAKVKFEKSETSKPSELHLKIKDAFLRYAPESDSWTFGVLQKQNAFNFRAKSLKPYTPNHPDQTKSSPLHLNQYAAQSMHINGNLTIKGQSSFVTGKDSWLMHTWQDTLDLDLRSYTLLTCRFSDLSGIMVFQGIPLKHGLPFKIASYQTNSGETSSPAFTLSSFKKQDLPAWRLSIPSEKITLNLAATPEDSGVASRYLPEFYKGFTTVSGNKAGYCGVEIFQNRQVL